MSDEQEKLVAVISPWDKLAAVVKKQFRVETLPVEKKVAVWRDDLQTEEALRGELNQLGVASLEIRTRMVTTSWKGID